MFATCSRLNLSLFLSIAAIAYITPPLLGNPASVLSFNQMGIAVILAISYNLLIGNTGLLSLGHAAYYGFGGFFTVRVILALSADESIITLPFIPLLGGFAGLLGAIILGSFTTKRGGLIFAMLSFAMAELVLASTSVFGRFYGGSIDRTEIPTFFGFDFQSDIQVSYVVWTWVLICLLGAAFFNASPLGKLTKAAGQNEERVEYIGYSQHKLKYITFCLSGFMAGIAGALFALTYEFVTVELIRLQQSWLILQMVFIGGIGTFWGPPIGAILLTLLFSGFRDLTDIWNLYASLVFLSLVLFAPHGLAGIATSLLVKFRSGELSGKLKHYGFLTFSVLGTIIGFTGLCEMIYALRNPWLTSGDLSLFWLVVNPHHLLPWICFLFLFTSGIFFFQKFYSASSSQS
ncbi:MAG: branched-chain amino acid ABC transporter permease [Sneathiellales bacterium]|nr:branched-chain amino acid ABC transporter permease [Sneathiellales bacterium]